MRVAISGKSGCGNTTITRMVSEALGVRMVNYTFRNLARELGFSFEELCRRADEDPSYDRYVDTRQVELAMEGDAILGSRLAVWMLSEADLKVYLTASLDERARRIQQREGGDIAEVKRRTQERDRLDRERYLRLYNIDNDDTSAADLVIDTDEKSPEEVTRLIVAEAKRRAGKKE